MDRHHNGENDFAFTKIAEQYPELSPVLEEFTYEEKRIVSALNALKVPGRDHTRPTFLLTGGEES